MSEEELTNKEELEEILLEFKYKVDVLYRTRDGIENLINRYEKIVSEIPAKELNALITFGFVPNAVFTLKIQDEIKEFTFKGYTEGNRMIFKNKDGENVYADIISVYKSLDKFTKG